MRAAAISVGLLIAVVSSPAIADGGGSGGDGGVELWLNQNTSVDAPNSSAHSNQVTPTVTEVGLDDLFCVGTNWSESCASPPEEPGQALSGEMVAQAFQFVPLPPSNLIIQPPNGRTLVNFKTNFYTDAAAEQIISVTLLGQVVELRVWPAQFTWHFGDGATTTTTERGSAYPALDITHEYAKKGDVAPSLDTTYAAEWRLQGQQAWQPVQGTVTIAGEPSALTVLTATPTLVG